MRTLCMKCKGRGWCNQRCIHLQRLRQAPRPPESTELNTQAPAPFIGRVGYPYVNVGVLSPPEKREDADEYDAPEQWAKKDYQIPDIVGMRSALLNSRTKMGVLEHNRFSETIQEIGMASKPVDIDISLSKKPRFSLNLDNFSAPTGPKAPMQKAEVTANPLIERSVEKAHEDTEVNAHTAVSELYRKGHAPDRLSRIFSVGSIGVQNRRKVVPTRWSITAVDDTLGQDLRTKVRDYQESGFYAYFDGYLGNNYLVLMFPGSWSYELFELYLPHASWNTSNEPDFSSDYEGYAGRKEYAHNCAGGYYAARLAVLEKLHEMKRQASVLVFRFITDEYTTPLGVWVCREACRRALNNRPLEFSDRELLVHYAKLIASKKFGAGIEGIMKKSQLMEQLRHQRRLDAFFS